MTRPKAAAILITVVLLIAVLSILLPTIPQTQAYHNFADRRGWLGIPNFGDVFSNAAFAMVGIWGLVLLIWPDRIHFERGSERWLYLIVFSGLIWTAFGSGYYHLAPDNARLVWDRLPIIVVFMALVAAVMAERFSPRTGLLLLPVLLTIGCGSVLQWRASEQRGHGDLRFYAAVQVGSILLLLLALLLPSRYTRGSDYGIVVGFYVLAKIFETADRQIFAVGRVVSGHTLKHLAAAAAGYWILRMLDRRTPRQNRSARTVS